MFTESSCWKQSFWNSNVLGGGVGTDKNSVLSTTLVPYEKHTEHSVALQWGSTVEFGYQVLRPYRS